MSRTADAHERITAEIVREKAAALGRTGERLEVAIEELARVGRELEAATAPAARARLARAWEAMRARVMAARLDLLIQREAVGLRRHAVVDQRFPLPPRRPPAASA